MAARKKKRFWNEGGIPELGENPPPRAIPKPSPSTVTVGHSTAAHFPDAFGLRRGDEPECEACSGPLMPGARYRSADGKLWCPKHAPAGAEGE